MDSKILNRLTAISLEEMDKVKLMNRIDTKYVLSSGILMRILTEIANDYFILEIDNIRLFPYNSLYFDTAENEMYKAHHNGKMNRYKIRIREYISSNLFFLEVKRKVKGIRTLKNRIVVDSMADILSEEQKDFIIKYTPFNPEELQSKHSTKFHRITLVNKLFNERVTIDTSLEFGNPKLNNSLHLDQLCIIELKRAGNTLNSKLSHTLKHYGILPSGMSKYCLGRALTEKDIKSNNFKRKILTLNKIEHGEFYYRNI
jgi:hypothetical protein